MVACKPEARASIDFVMAEVGATSEPSQDHRVRPLIVPITQVVEAVESGGAEQDTSDASESEERSSSSSSSSPESVTITRSEPPGSGFVEFILDLIHFERS